METEEGIGAGENGGLVETAHPGRRDGGSWRGWRKEGAHGIIWGRTGRSRCVHVSVYRHRLCGVRRRGWGRFSRVRQTWFEVLGFGTHQLVALGNI